MVKTQIHENEEMEMCLYQGSRRTFVMFTSLKNKRLKAKYATILKSADDTEVGILRFRVP